MEELLSLSLGQSSIERTRNEHFDTLKLGAKSTEGEGEGEFAIFSAKCWDRRSS